MKITKELSIHDFEPWSGAVSTYNKIEEEGKLDELEYMLEELFPEGADETSINDLLWFEEEMIYEWLGISEEEEEEEEETNETV